MRVQIIKNEKEGKVEAKDKDDVVGLMTFSIASETLVIVEHTGVKPQLRGKGIALKLLECLVTDARNSGYKIKPLCSYVVVMLKRHPDFGDVIIN